MILEYALEDPTWTWTFQLQTSVTILVLKKDLACTPDASMLWLDKLLIERLEG